MNWPVNLIHYPKLPKVRVWSVQHPNPGWNVQQEGLKTNRPQPKKRRGSNLRDISYKWSLTTGFYQFGLLGWLIFISRWNFFPVQWGQIFWGWIWQRRWRQRGWSWTLFMFCFLKILHQDSAVGLNNLAINLVQVQAVAYHTFSVPENLNFFANCIKFNYMHWDSI